LAWRAVLSSSDPCREPFLRSGVSPNPSEAVDGGESFGMTNQLTHEEHISLEL
jgi:hypothetical protein